MKMKKNYKIVTTFWFIIGLSLLLLNDFFFKENFGNWLTGKLSDFAGLFVFSLFWTVFIPKHKVKLFCLTGFLFVYWKSPFSQNFIDMWNNLGIFQVSRVVDYADLLALTVLPIAFFIEKRKESLKKIQINPILPLIIASFSFLATSYLTDIEAENDYQFDFPIDTLAKRIYFLPTIQNPYRENKELYQQDSLGKHQIQKYNLDTIVADKSAIDKFVTDTMTIFVYDDFCFKGYSAILIPTGDNHKSQIRLLGFHHSCPKNKKDKKIITESFNKKVIELLKRNEPE